MTGKLVLRFFFEIDAVTMDYCRPNKKKRKTKVDKGNKGLRHFSRRVCEKVESKKVTSYNEVADELVAEAPDKSTGGLIDQVRRVRHYQSSRTNYFIYF
jgi:hypothetical protein